MTHYVVPEELVKHWNFNTNSLEGAALDAMKEYITLQDQLKDYITLLVDITSHINNIALKHNPEALLNYLDFLVKSARAQGCHSAQLQALIKVSTLKVFIVCIRNCTKNGLIFRPKMPWLQHAMLEPEEETLLWMLLWC